MLSKQFHGNDLTCDLFITNRIPVARRESAGDDDVYLYIFFRSSKLVLGEEK